MKDCVSIIVTSYNHEKNITKCLDSIFLQTYHNIELLVIDNHSTDRTKRLISEKLSNSPFEKTEFILQPQSNLGLVKNRGLNWAKGEFLLFINGDNYLENVYIETLISTAQTHNADIIYTDILDFKTRAIYKKSPEFELNSYLKLNYIQDGSLIRTVTINNCKYDLKLDQNSVLNYDFFLNMILEMQAKPHKCYETNIVVQNLNNLNWIDDSRLVGERAEAYLYILKKYIQICPKVIFDVVREQVSQLISQLHRLKLNEEKMIQLKDVDQPSDCIQTSSTLNNKNYILENITDIKNRKLETEIKELKKENQFLTSQISFLNIEKEQILHSRSYRIGNLLFKPFRILVKILKNPKLMIKGFRKIKRTLGIQLKKVPMPKTLILKNIRSLQRNKNNYENPRRILIFVIFENQEQLQPYKLYFLKALAKLAEEVLIVANGSLPEKDILTLSKIGRVEVRENKGYDTAAFRYGIDFLGKSRLGTYDELLLVNDTNVGPIEDFSTMFSKMSKKKVDFWGISYGEEQTDFTQLNKYGYIPVHLQSYFLVIEKSLLDYDGFYDYWEKLVDTNSRDKAIGKHETVFTKHFENLGFKHGALTTNNFDSPMYIHPLTMVKEGVPLIKYSAFANDTNDAFAWQGLSRETEVPQLLEYLKHETDYPLTIINQIVLDLKKTERKKHVLLIDGVENAIPQLTTYRIKNKREQLESLGYEVWTVNLSDFQMGYGEQASMIIIYRAPINESLIQLVHLAKQYHKPVLYDIDDLVIDVKFTDQLTYVQQLSDVEKRNYDNGVISYGEMMKLCDGIVTSTRTMQTHLLDYKPLVLLNRNLANHQLVEISKKVSKNYSKSTKIVKIGYFSGSITHNENFDLIKNTIIRLFEKHDNLELHLVGHLNIPSEFNAFKTRINIHSFVPWEKLPELIAEVDINLAPLVTSTFNEAKSEIKWIEASLVNVPTVASNIGAFKEMIQDSITGLLVDDDGWFEVLDSLIQSKEKREYIASNANQYVLTYCTTEKKKDQFTDFIKENHVKKHI